MILSPRRHRLTFDIPSPGGGEVNNWEFYTQEEIMGVEVGYDVQDEELAEMGFANSPRRTENLEEFVKTFCRKKDTTAEVRRTLKWMSKLDVHPRSFFIEFAVEHAFGSGFAGRAIVGNRRRALLCLEFMRDPRGMAFPISEECQDIIPHELMHVKDVLDGRSPTLYPLTSMREGGWIDLFRHLWIDGYLDRMGLPHVPKSTRLWEIAQRLKNTGKVLSAAKLSLLGEKWWGKPMTFTEAIQVGLDLGFPLEKGCPMEKWFAAQFSQGGKRP